MWNYLRQELKLFRYKLHLPPDLFEDYESIRLHLARNSRRELRNNSIYLRQIVFSDECLFSVSRRVNKQNCRSWGTALPRKMYQVRRDSPAVIVRCTNKIVIGNPNKLILPHYLMPKLRDYRDNKIFQQYGTPLHYSTEVRNFLAEKLPGRWMEQGGAILYPVFSPDLAPCEHFL